MSNELTEVEVAQWLVDRERGGWQFAVERILANRETVLRAQIAKDEQVKALREASTKWAGEYERVTISHPKKTKIRAALRMASALASERADRIAEEAKR